MARHKDDKIYYAKKIVQKGSYQSHDILRKTVCPRLISFHLCEICEFPRFQKLLPSKSLTVTAHKNGKLESLTALNYYQFPSGVAVFRQYSWLHINVNPRDK